MWTEYWLWVEKCTRKKNKASLAGTLMKMGLSGGTVCFPYTSKRFLPFLTKLGFLEDLV